MVGLYFALIKQVFIHELLDTLGKHLSLKVSQGTFLCSSKAKMLHVLDIVKCKEDLK